MSSAKQAEETIKVIKFDGAKEDEWRIWNTKLRAIAAIKNWEERLDNKIDSKIDQKKPANDDERKIVKQENDAKLYLTLACTGTAFEYIVGKKSAKEMYESLKDRYEPEEVDDYLELMDKFQNCRLENEESDPEKWFHKIEHLRVRMKNIDADYNKNDLEIKAFILKNLPKEYSEIVTIEMKTMAKTELKDMKKEIMKFYRRKIKTEEKKEEALNADAKRPSNPKYKGEKPEKRPWNTKKFRGTCACCGFQGHRKEDCFQKEKSCKICNKVGHLARMCKNKGGDDKDDSKEEDAEDEFVGTVEVQRSWLGDSGASVHITDDKRDLKNESKCNTMVKVGGGGNYNAITKGEVKLEINKQSVKLKDILYIPKFGQKIISIGRMLKNSAKMIAEGEKMSVQTKKNTLIFETTNGSPLMYLREIKGREEEVNANEITMEINEAHEVFGHINDQQLKNTTKVLGIKLTGVMKTCQGCQQAKAKAKGVKKFTNANTKAPGERIFADTSGPFKKSLGGNTLWIKMVDDYSRFSWSMFAKNKSEFGEKVIQKIKSIEKGAKK